MVLCDRCQHHIGDRGLRPTVNNPYVDRGTCEMCGQSVGEKSAATIDFSDGF
jgi:hypothetical protein